MNNGIACMEWASVPHQLHPGPVSSLALEAYATTCSWPMVKICDELPAIAPGCQYAMKMGSWAMFGRVSTSSHLSVRFSSLKAYYQA